jgi:hypothetical protein
LSDLADRSDCALSRLHLARPADDHAEDRREMHLLRDERLRRGAHERGSAAQVIGRVGHVAIQESQDLGRPLGQADEHPAIDDGSDLVQLERELGDDPEVAAAAPQAPEQLWVLLAARRQQAAVGGHHLRGEEIVAGQPAASLEPPAAAAERQACDAGARDASPGDGKSVCLCRGVELAPGQPRLSPAGTRARVHLDCLHWRQIDHQRVVPGPVAEPMAAATDRDLEPLLAREGDRCLNVRGRTATGDHGRMAIETAVPDLACLLVSRVALPQELAAEGAGETLQRRS